MLLPAPAHNLTGIRRKETRERAVQWESFTLGVKEDFSASLRLSHCHRGWG